jgi:AmmeMemoRadiSam system protein B
MDDVRPSPIAGTWYPGQAEDLRASIARYLRDAVVPEIPGEVIGVIAPHAGYRYSGQIAAYAFQCLRGMQPEVIAVLSPMHHPYPAPLYTSGHQAYATPLGELPIDGASLEALRTQLNQQANIELDRVRRDPEHALEIELPFLQYVIPSPFQLLPIMVRDQSARTAQALGAALAAVLRRKHFLLVASSDLSHFYTDEAARRLDQHMLSKIEAFDPAGVLAAEAEGAGFACGRGAIASVLWAAKELGADKVQVLKYGNSGQMTGDWDRVVGYAAAVITRPTHCRAAETA